MNYMINVFIITGGIVLILALARLVGFIFEKFAGYDCNL